MPGAVARRDGRPPRFRLGRRGVARRRVVQMEPGGVPDLNHRLLFGIIGITAGHRNGRDGVIPQGEGDLFQMVIAQRIGFAPGLQIHSGRCAEAGERQRHEQTDQQLAADRGHRVVGIR
jgi:hypothetical protein